MDVARLPAIALASLLALLAALPCSAQPDAEGYRSVHPPPPPWLVQRFEGTMRTVLGVGFDGPEVHRELVRPFLYETYEHVREVNELMRGMGARPRDLPGEAPGSKDALKGIHDFGERVSLARLEAWVEGLRANPPKGADGRALPIPRWVIELPNRVRQSGAKTFDVGKLSPYVVAGLSRPGNPDVFAIELHRLSAHHLHQSREGWPGKNLLFEALADKINAMRQVRVYNPKPLPFERIREILRADRGKGLPPDSGPMIEEALATQAKLERTGKVNPYHLAERDGYQRPRQRLAAYRRADGTLNWRRMGRDGALRGAGGLAHFGLALFLKELAVVARTGDRARIEEFFDGLATTDFYVTYGLFALGAKAGDVAYARYLERFVKPRFVSGVLRTNLVLATGLALPQLIGGTFEGKAFAISVTSLGLSTAAVRSGAAAIGWLTSLKKAREAGTLGRLAGGRLLRVGGWFYAVAELAVILYAGEAIEERVHGFLDLREARHSLADAGATFLDAVDDPAASAESVSAGAEAIHGAFTDYRDFLYTPLLLDEARFAARMARVARKAKLAEDQRVDVRGRLAGHKALEAEIHGRHGTTDLYASQLSAKEDKKLARDVATFVDSYERSRAEHLREVYEDHRRDSPLLERSLDDPYRGRDDLLARKARERERAHLRDALLDVSQNRLQAYADEAELLSAAAASLRARGRPDLAESLDALKARVQAIAEADRRLFGGGGSLTAIQPD